MARPEDDGNVLVLLKQAQARSGYIPEAAIAEIAKSLGRPVSEVYGVASFYSFLSCKPLGRHVIRVCRSLPCHLKESEKMVDRVSRAIGIKPGQTTADGRFSLELVNCIGACDQSPAMLVDSDLHGGLTPARIARILKSYD